MTMKPCDCELRVSADAQKCEDFVKPVGALRVSLLKVHPPMETPSRPRLLIVDDDRRLAGLIRDYLTPMGYDIELRHTGPDGLAEALASPYEAVILDVMMPGMDGFAGPLRLCEETHIAVLDDQPLDLTTLEFAILASLLKSRCRVKSRERLIEEVSERRFDVFDRSIDVHVSSLRRKLYDDAKNPRFIRTIRGVGYSLRDPENPEGIRS